MVKNKHCLLFIIIMLSYTLNPENANAYDSLGEAYVRDNNTDQAIKAYKKAIELNPNNSQAKIVLQSLVNQQANLIKEKNE